MSSNKKNKVKGTVLYTVVAVMSIMTVLVFAAMTLVASANRRSYNNFANNQTQFTAKSVIDAITSNNDIISELSKCAKGAKRKITVDGVPSSMGKVKSAYIERMDTNNFKLSVTVEMAGQDNTIAAYYNYPDVRERESFNYSFVSLSKADLGGLNSLGGISLSASYSDGDLSGAKITNGSFMDSPIRVNGDLSISTSLDINITQRDGLFLKGLFEINNTTNFNSVITTSKLNYRDLPYIFNYERYYGSYSGGDIWLNSSSVTFGTENTPFLVIGRNIKEKNGVTYPLYGDLYLYDRYDTSFMTGGLRSWTKNDVLAKRIAGTTTNEPYTGGNLYSQGAVYFAIPSGSTVEVANNVVIKKFLVDDDTRNNPSEIKTRGVIVAEEADLGDKLSVNDSTNAKGFFVNPEKIKISPGDKVNGVEYPSLDREKGNPSKTIYSTEYINNEYLESKGYLTDEDKQAYISGLNTSKSEYYSVYPNIYWNREGKRASDEKEHVYYFDLSNMKEGWGGTAVTYDPDYYDFYLKAVNISLDFNQTSWATLDVKLLDTFVDRNDVATSDKVYAEFNPTPPTDDPKYNCYYNSFNNIRIPCSAPYVLKFENSGDTEIKLKNTNTLAFHVKGMDGDSLKTNGIRLEVEARRKPQYNVTVNHLKKANDVAFSKAAGGIIQADDIDKSVRIIKNPDNTYTIEKADLTALKEGDEANAIFNQVAYNPTKTIINYTGVKGTTFADQKIGEVTYRKDIPAEEASQWVYSFNADNYDVFLKAVVETLSYPESFGTHHYYGDLREIDPITGDWARFVTDANKNLIGPKVDRGKSPLGPFANYRMYDSYKSFMKKYDDEGNFLRYECEEYTADDFGLTELWLYDPFKEMDGAPESEYLQKVDSVSLPVRLYQSYYDDYDDDPDHEYLKKVELSNLLVSQRQFGYNGFVDDTQLYGNMLKHTSDLREYAKNRAKELFKVSDTYTDSTVYGTGGEAYPDVISKSCTFKYEIPKNKTIMIVPKGDLYIKLVPDPTAIKENYKIDSSDYTDPGTDVEYKFFTFNEGVNIIVDDREGTVNFLVPQGASVRMFKNVKILNQYYYDEYTNNLVNVPNNPAVKKNGSTCVDNKKIPDIYFYINPIDEENFYKMPKFQMREGGNAISGYILAARALLEVSSTGTMPKIKYHYAKVPCEETSTGNNWLDNDSAVEKKCGNMLVGSCIFEQTRIAQDALTVGYVNPNPADEYGNKYPESVLQFQYYQMY